MAPVEKKQWRPREMRRQNLSAQAQAAIKCLDSGFVRAPPATLGQSPTVGLSDLGPDSY